MLSKKIDILLITKHSHHSTTGFYVMNEMVNNIDFSKKNIKSKSLRLFSVNTKIKGVLILFTLIKVFLYSLKLFLYLIYFRPRVVYFTISPVNTFVRDLAYVGILKLFKCEIVYHLHGKGIENKCQDQKFYQLLYKWAYFHVNVISLSKKLECDFNFLPIKNSFVLPNVISHNKLYKKAKKTKGINALWLSNLIKTKRIQDFIEAIKLSLDDEIEISASIIGAQYDYQVSDYQKDIKGYESSFIYHGPLYGQEKFKELSKSDIFIFPTSFDTWGIVILEAMQQGLAVIATDEGGITDMIEDGVNGFIVEKNNPQDIKDKLKALSKNPQLVKDMGERNKKKVKEKFSPEAFERNIIDIFKEIIKK